VAGNNQSAPEWAEQLVKKINHFMAEIILCGQPLVSTNGYSDLATSWICDIVLI
jgi:hypothetical protein